MFGLGKKQINSSMTTIYLCLFILLINQFVIVRSFRLSSSDLDQVEQIIFIFKNSTEKEKTKSNDLVFDEFS